MIGSPQRRRTFNVKEEGVYSNMNILKKELKIFGQYSSKKVSGSFKKIFKNIRKIKKELGTDNYKLDKYLNMLLNLISLESNTNAADEGATAFCELRSICLSILNLDERYQNHGFYKKAKEFIETNRFKYKEEDTLLEIYTALLTPQFTDFVVEKYIKKLKHQSSSILDIVDLHQTYEHLSNIVGKSKMDFLNSKIIELFLFCPAVNSFLQSMADDYLLCLLYRDVETSKQIFQLITD